VIHLLPVLGVLSADRLAGLYGVELPDPNLRILLRHRAVLFGVVAVTCIVAAFWVALRPLAMSAGFVSMLSFIALCGLEREWNTQLRRVLITDVVASILLAIGLAIDLITTPAP